MKDLAHRGFVARELRFEGSGTARRLRGYAAVFNQEAELWPGYREVIRPGAFAKSLASGKPIKALHNHDTGIVIGSTPRTLRVWEDTRGLAFEIEPPDTALVRDQVLEPIRRGDVTGVSFGFRAVVADETARNTGQGVEIVREIREAELFEISPVAFPAYAGTSVQLEARDRLRAHEGAMGGTMRNATEIRAEIDEIRAGAQGRAPTPYEERRIRSLEQELEGASTRTAPPPQERPDPTAGRAPAVHTAPRGTYSILNVLRASSDLRAAQYELRISDMLKERFGPAADERAFRIPYRALLTLKRQRELDQIETLEASLRAPERRDIDSTTGASLIAVDQGAEDFIELLRNETVVAEAGARMLPGLVGTLDIPRQNARAAGAWIATETGAPAETNLTTDKITLSPKTFGVRQEITRKMLKQATPAAEDLAREDIRRTIGIGVDLASLSGSGASGQPQGLIGTSGVGGVVHGGALTATLANILEYETDLGTANAPTGRRAWVMRSAARAALKSTPKAAGVAAGFLMEMDGTINGSPSFVTEQAPASGAAGALIFGAWSEMIIGLWGVLDLFGDPYTLGNSGGMVVRGFQDIDIGVRHGASFSASSVF